MRSQNNNLTSATSEKDFPLERRQSGIVSEQAKRSLKVNEPSGTEPQQEVFRNEDGLIIVKQKHDIFYIRHNIIIAKAGDIFYMPRKVPENFIINEETLMSKEDLEKLDAYLKVF
jgi:hypothetical protein